MQPFPDDVLPEDFVPAQFERLLTSCGFVTEVTQGDMGSLVWIVSHPEFHVDPFCIATHFPHRLRDVHFLALFQPLTEKTADELVHLADGLNAVLPNLRFRTGEGEATPLLVCEYHWLAPDGTTYRMLGDVLLAFLLHLSEASRLARNAFAICHPTP